MGDYLVTITETRTRTFLVKDVEDSKEAECTVEEAFDSNIIDLLPEDSSPDYSFSARELTGDDDPEDYVEVGRF